MGKGESESLGLLALPARLPLLTLLLALAVTAVLGARAIRTDDDVRDVIAMLRLNYDRAASR